MIYSFVDLTVICCEMWLPEMFWGSGFIFQLSLTADITAPWHHIHILHNCDTTLPYNQIDLFFLNIEWCKYSGGLCVYDVSHGASVFPGGLVSAVCGGLPWSRPLAAALWGRTSAWEHQEAAAVAVWAAGGAGLCYQKHRWGVSVLTFNSVYWTQPSAFTWVGFTMIVIII